MSLKRRQSRSTVELLIPLALMSSARCAGTILPLKRILYSIVVSVMDLSGSSIMSALSTGSSRRWPRRRRRIWFPTPGSNSSVRSARNHILMFSDPMAYLTGSSMWSKTFPKTEIIFFWRVWLSKRIAREWSISSCQTKRRRCSS